MANLGLLGNLLVLMGQCWSMPGLGAQFGSGMPLRLVDSNQNLMIKVFCLYLDELGFLSKSGFDVKITSEELQHCG